MCETTLFDAREYLSTHARDAQAHQRINASTSTSELIDPEWITRAAAEGLIAREFYSWVLEDKRFDADDLADLLEERFDVLASAMYRRGGKFEAMLRIGRALVNIAMPNRQWLWAGVAAKTQEEACGVLDHLLTILPERAATDDAKPRVPITVWTAEGREPMTRNTDVQPWEALTANYPAATREQLARLMTPDFQAGKGGRLLLFHGDPGTGKSTAIMSLGWEWRRLGALHYIADVSKFLGSPHYLLQVTFGGGSDDDWRVVVLEDSGGLFAPDAKVSTGEDPLGRLLNLTDGVLGNSSKALVILTTNEPLSSFHAAISRPGRCAAIVEFKPFSAGEARSWFEARGRADLAAEVDGERTLAQCFALLEGNRVDIAPTHRVGFKAGID